MVKVSQEYFIEMNQNEALAYCEKKEKLLDGQVQRLEKLIAETKAHITFVNAAIGEILKFSGDATT